MIGFSPKPGKRHNVATLVIRRRRRFGIGSELGLLTGQLSREVPNPHKRGYNLGITTRLF